MDKNNDNLNPVNNMSENSEIPENINEPKNQTESVKADCGSENQKENIKIHLPDDDDYPDYDDKYGSDGENDCKADISKFPGMIRNPVNKVMVSAVLLFIVALIACTVFILRDKIVPGWYENENGRYHISLISGKDTGLTEIGGQYYIFSYKGYLLYGWNKVDGFYYYSDENGKVIREQYTIGQENYNFDASDGRLYTGVRIVDGKLYYYDDHGFRQYGVAEINGEYYSFNQKGALDYGLKAVGGKTYYFNNQGIAQTGEQTVDGKTYYFGKDGAAVSGRMIDGDYCYYFDDSFNKVYGWMTGDDEHTYYYSTSGILTKGIEVIDGSKYFFDKNGICADCITFADGNAYYAGKTGWQTVGSTLYFFDGNGRMYISEFADDGGSRYYFDEDGIMTVGWLTLGEDYYYFTEDGKMAIGTVNISGKDYIFGEDGKMFSDTESDTNAFTE